MIQYLVTLAVAVTPILIIAGGLIGADYVMQQNIKKKLDLEQKRLQQPNRPF